MEVEVTGVGERLLEDMKAATDSINVVPFLKKLIPRC
jgi:hypothetical protein